ncbi:hypothetical protein HY375_00205 [Candidatus Berkelbacteria bacterium]|nr:hypothetical protein [Candidatus Berkelbacteria bacterium]
MTINTFQNTTRGEPVAVTATEPTTGHCGTTATTRTTATPTPNAVT